MSDAEKKEELKTTLDEIMSKHWDYVGHLLRTKHQGDYYRFILKNLSAGEIVVIMDYKMKLELGMRLRENQREWYGKRGLSLHGFYVVAQVHTIIFLLDNLFSVNMFIDEVELLSFFVSYFSVLYHWCFF